MKRKKRMIALNGGKFGIIRVLVGVAGAVVVFTACGEKEKSSSRQLSEDSKTHEIKASSRP